MLYFEDNTVVGDVMSLTPSPDCKFRAHEVARLTWFEKQLNDACFRSEEDKVLLGTANTTDVACGNEINGTILSILESLKITSMKCSLSPVKTVGTIRRIEFKIIGNSRTF